MNSTSLRIIVPLLPGFWFSYVILGSTPNLDVLSQSSANLITQNKIQDLHKVFENFFVFFNRGKKHVPCNVLFVHVPILFIHPHIWKSMNKCIKIVHRNKLFIVGSIYEPIWLELFPEIINDTINFKWTQNKCFNTIYLGKTNKSENRKGIHG